jgi:copper chaperone CopZ
MRKSTTFEVTGDNPLTCEGCEQRVEHALKAVAGVDQVRADARTQRIRVLFDATKVSATVIAERLSQAGYEIRVGVER